MPVAIFHLPDGTSITTTPQIGDTVMEAAREAGVEGVIAECGGGAICGTCHVHVAPTWFDRLPPPDTMEEALLDFVHEPSPTSRLSCQLVVTPELDGIEVRVPDEQVAM